ncbi:MAG: hypothetical protein V8R85_03135 [Frisingicoccus sp.]
MTLAEQLKSVIGQGMVWENEPMKNHTTFRYRRTGGYFCLS